MPFSFGEEPLNVGESTAVNCMITKGDLPLNITWTLNNKKLTSGSDGITIARISARLSALTIESIGGEHRGMFQCIASNAAGSTELESELKANGEYGIKSYKGISPLTDYYSKLTVILH